jgi:endonuclease/exonuclease/phosphatase family metal-dependent hydrolase
MGAVVRIVSYNIQGHAARKKPDHLRGIAEVLKRLAPDVVGLQEVHRNTTVARSVDQSEILSKETGLQLAFGRSFAGLGGEYGNAVLTRGEIGTTTVHPLPGKGEPRTAVQCQIRLDSLTMDFFVTHLAAWFWLLRKTRARQVAELVRMTASAPAAVLVGDFNASPSAREMAPIVKCEHLQSCGTRCEATHGFSKQHLDYVFFDRGWNVKESVVMKIGPSDHWPHLVVLERADAR